MSTSADCPSWLDQKARLQWRRVMATVDVEAVGADAVAAYCFVHSLWTQARDAMEASGHDEHQMWTGVDGASREHPCAVVEARLASLVSELAGAIGIAPEQPATRRSTRILFVDEGSPD
jgi:phage terminase small subunit